MRKGFSLVELMIVVAIIGILAAIAIPNFSRMQLKSKRAEVPGNINGIKTAELAYEASYDTFVADAGLPSGNPQKSPTAWPAAGSAGGFDQIGWRPDGEVRGFYSMTATDTEFTVTGTSDVDGDSVPAIYTATNETNATLGTGLEDVY